MNEKKIIFIVFSFIVTVICASCRTTKINNADVIERNSRTVGQLETTVNELDRTIIDSRIRISNIIETSRNITDGIERIEYLFRQYEFEVDRLLSDIDTIRNKIKIESENDKYIVSDIDDYDNN